MNTNSRHNTTHSQLRVITHEEPCCWSASCHFLHDTMSSPWAVPCFQIFHAKHTGFCRRKYINKKSITFLCVSIRLAVFHSLKISLIITISNRHYRQRRQSSMTTENLSKLLHPSCVLFGGNAGEAKGSDASRVQTCFSSSLMLPRLSSQHHEGRREKKKKKWCF